MGYGYTARRAAAEAHGIFRHAACKAQAITTRVEERGEGIFPSPEVLRIAHFGRHGSSRCPKPPGTTGCHHVSSFHHGWLLLDDMLSR